MNEELQRELISILRAMKEGSPSAWHELVAQRSGYLTATGIAGLIGAVLFCIAGVVLIRIGLRAKQDGWQAIGAIVGAASLIGMLMVGGFAIGSLIAGAYPLGRVLGAIR